MDDGESHEQVIRQLWDRAVPHFEVTNLLEILKQDISEAPFTCHDFYRHNKKDIGRFSTFLKMSKFFKKIIKN